jgi:hypothetical protein
MSRQARIVFTRWWLEELAPDLDMISPRLKKRESERYRLGIGEKIPPIGQLPLLL